MKQIRSLQNRITPTAPWRWVFFLIVCALTGMGLAMAAWLITTQSPLLCLSALKTAAYWLTALFLFCLTAAVGLFTHSLFVGAFLVAIPTVLLTLINHFKLAITSTPLQIGDFVLAAQLGDIASLNADAIVPTWETILAVAAVVVWLAVVLFFSRPLRPGWTRAMILSPVPLLIFLLIFQVGANAMVYTPLNAPLDVQTLSQSGANSRCGVLLGLWRSFLCAGQPQAQPSGPDQDTMQALADQLSQEYPPSENTTDREQPNIILILSESFFDVTTLPGVTYENDPLAEFHALQKEGVSGSFYTRTVGYGTSNIELEILTGINTSLLSWENLYSLEPELFTRLPSIPALLEKDGYETTMFHLFNDSIYSREPVFKALGFDHIYFSEDFAQVDPEAAAAPDYWAFMNERIAGDFYSDSYMTDLFIDMYEQRGEKPLFLYGISMENHSPYDGSKYAEDGYTVSFTSGLSDSNAGILLDVSQGAANASAALGRLVDYFREEEEPTVIIFYGDHRPGLGLSDGVSSVYSALGMTPGTDQSQWTPEQLAGMHSTSYLIWSNDPNYLPAQPGSIQDVSCNYFGLSVLDSAGVSLPLYWRMLEGLSTTRLIDTVEYHLGRDGVPSATANASPEDQLRLDHLAACFRDALYGSQHITHRLWE